MGIPEDMKAEGKPWDAPVNLTPLEDMKKMSEAVREHGVPIDSPEAWPQRLPPAVGLRRRVLARLWPEDRNRPRMDFGRDHGTNDFSFSVRVGRDTYAACYLLGRGVSLTFGHGRECDCDECLPF